MHGQHAGLGIPGGKHRGPVRVGGLGELQPEGQPLRPLPAEVELGDRAGGKERLGGQRRWAEHQMPLCVDHSGLPGRHAGQSAEARSLAEPVGQVRKLQLRFVMQRVAVCVGAATGRDELDGRAGNGLAGEGVDTGRWRDGDGCAGGDVDDGGIVEAPLLLAGESIGLPEAGTGAEGGVEHPEGLGGPLSSLGRSNMAFVGARVQGEIARA